MTGERSGQFASQAAHPGLRLDALLERMAAPQLIRMAARFAPGEDARQIQKARTAVERTLQSPARLGALVQTLTPLEVFLLGEVKRAGGVQDGWALLVAARVRGLRPDGKPAPVELYRHFRPAAFAGAEVIWPLLADGLLMPFTLPNPFMEGFGRGLEAGSSLVTADERLLAALPDAPRPPARLALQESPAAPAPVPAPQRTQLQLQETLRAVQAEGGLALTKTGEYNRNALKRLQKRAPALPDLEFWLEVTQLGGLLEVQGEALQPTPAATDLHAFSPDALRGLYPGLAETWEPSGQLVAHLHPLRAALLAVLREVPPLTVAQLAQVFEASTPDTLRLPSWRGQGLQWRPWLTEALTGPLRTLGLVSVTGEGEGAVVTPAPDAPSTPGGPAWVVQPNFEVVAYPAQLDAAALGLLHAAEAVRFDEHSATYRLTRESVYAALEGGMTLDALLGGLERASAAPVPGGVRSTVQGWAARRERLVFHQGVTLLEFPDGAARDAYRAVSGGRAIGETLLLPAPDRAVPRGAPVLRYDRPPRPALRVTPGGLITRHGDLDFLGRDLLARVTRPVPGGYDLVPGPMTALTVRELESRVEGTLPPLMRLQLERWSGTQPAPALGQVTLLQHPQATALLQDPTLAPLLEGLLAPGLLLVRAGREAALREQLSALGLAPDAAFTAATGASGARAGTPDYEFPEDTRRKRALLEEAIRDGRQVHLMYQTETYHGWYGESRPGKTRQRRLVPREIYREGSTPYLLAEGVDDPEEERIRVGYVLGIALL